MKMNTRDMMKEVACGMGRIFSSTCFVYVTVQQHKRTLKTYIGTCIKLFIQQFGYIVYEYWQTDRRGRCKSNDDVDVDGRVHQGCHDSDADHSASVSLQFSMRNIGTIQTLVFYPKDVVDHCQD